MNVDIFRHFYDYHFAENRSIWKNFVVPLSQEQFTQKIEYSIGSVRDHVVHLMSVDNTWFRGLQGLEVPEPLDPTQFDDRKLIREHWDHVEQNMRTYLANLRDEALFEKPFTFEEDKDFTVWHVLLHVVNHGTDHRAQLLRLINDLGVKTGPQDYIFYVYDHL